MSKYEIKFIEASGHWEILDKSARSNGLGGVCSFKDHREAFDYLEKCQKQESFNTMVWVILGILLLLILVLGHPDPPFYQGF